MCNFSSKIIQDKDNLFGDIMVLSLRYAIPRQTYIVPAVVDFIMQNKEHITKRVKDVMIKDINDALWKNDFKSGVEYDAFTQLLLFLEDLDFED